MDWLISSGVHPLIMLGSKGDDPLELLVRNLNVSYLYMLLDRVLPLTTLIKLQNKMVLL